MKTDSPINNVKLGIFVLGGVLFLLFSLYMIGRNRNMFSSTFTVSAYFRNINGLVPGNNVRFSGIDVGTVKSITIENDTSVRVTMIIDEEMHPHIKKNAVVAIGTDGLVGNKLVNINSRPGTSEPVQDGGVIESRLSVETEEILRTLQTTNGNIAVITENLKDVSIRLNQSATFWSLLSDQQLAGDVKAAVSHLNRAGANTERATAEAQELLGKLNSGDGLAEALFADTTLRKSLEKSVGDLQQTSQSLKVAAKQLSDVTSGVHEGKGTVGVLLSDSTTAEKLKQSISHIEQGSARFSENMEALKRNFLFRKYFKKQKASKPDR